MAAVTLHIGDIAPWHAGEFVEFLGGFDHGAADRGILVAGIEIDVVRRQRRERIDIAVLGQAAGARQKLLRIRLAEGGFHAALRRLYRVLRHPRGPIGEQPCGC
ncbi:hypothetical protein AUC70_01415 [Methyloceanibacter stevinii]|uniref:Uncharacterized protein n=1 Tax=Methyloceanibacter stevinii TaxID=1774970 RepID=A0A1E3VPZ3_9HYPH|nr:hypothetical protein AUC70_01415 [Methyloceanibacter stevinii]